MAPPIGVSITPNHNIWGLTEHGPCDTMKPWTSCGNSCPPHKHRWCCAAEFVHYGVAAPYERAYAALCQLLCSTTTAVSFCPAGPAANRRRRGVHIQGVWLPCPLWVAPSAVTVRCGRAPAENRPGSGTAASGTGERQALKLTGYTSDVGGLRPRTGRPFTAGTRRRAQGDSTDTS